MTLDSVASQFILPAVVGSLSAVIVAYLAFRRFRSEKWWELRAETYENIMDALFSLDRYFRSQARTEVTGDEPDDDEIAELLEEWNDASYKLEQVVFLGEFAISPKAVKTLNDLNRNLQNAAPPDKRFGLFRTQERYNFFRSQRKLIKGALMEVRSTAKRHLKVS